MDSAAVTRQVNHPSLLSRAYPGPDLNIMVGAILEMDKHPIEFNGPAFDSYLDCAERTALVHGNLIVVLAAIYMRLTQVYPGAKSIGMRGRRKAQNQETQSDATNCFLHFD